METTAGMANSPPTVAVHSQGHSVQQAVLAGKGSHPSPTAASRVSSFCHSAPYLPPMETGTNFARRTNFFYVGRLLAGSHWA